MCLCETGKAHRPLHVIVMTLILLGTMSATPWVVRHDVEIFWPIEFGIFIIMFSVGSIVLPDIIFHRRFMNAVMLRERGEMIFRILTTFAILTFVFDNEK